MHHAHLDDSKYSSFPLDRANDPYKGIRANFFGNHKKSMLWSVSATTALSPFQPPFDVIMAFSICQVSIDIADAEFAAEPLIAKAQGVYNSPSSNSLLSTQTSEQ